MISLFTLFACSKEELIMEEEIFGEELRTRSITPMTSPLFDWWDTTSISLQGIASPVTLPWYNGASTHIPAYILDDYKPEDGWEMVYNYCIDTPPGEIGKNYLIFYNKFTGILRIFYYNNNDVLPTTQTLWKLEVTANTSLFNGLGNIALPMSERINNPSVYVTNLTSLPSKSIGRGWNCFDVELAYDDQLEKNSNICFNIASYNLTSGVIELKGDIQLESDGTMVTLVSSQYPNWVNKVAKTTGDEAKKVIEKKLEKTVAKGVADAFTGGLASLVSTGAKWLFGSLTGKKDNTYRSDIQLSTAGEVNIRGEFSTTSIPNILPLANNVMPGTIKKTSDSFLPSYDEPLGVWNVEKLPTLYKSAYAELGFSEWEYYYTNYTDFKVRHSDDLFPVHAEELYYYYPDSLKIKINPAVLKDIDRYEVEIRCICEIKDTQGNKYNPDKMSGVSYQVKGGVDYLYTDSCIILEDTPIATTLDNYSGIRAFAATGVYPHHSEIPEDLYYRIQENGYVNYPVIIDGKRYDISPIHLNGEFYYKVMLTLYPKAPHNATPIVLMRTFKPEVKYVSYKSPKIVWAVRSRDVQTYRLFPTNTDIAGDLKFPGALEFVPGQEE